MTLKIGFVSTNECAPWGGSEELWYETVKVLLKDGIQVSVNVPYWSPIPSPIADLIDLGCPVEFQKNSRNETVRLRLREQIIDKLKDKAEKLLSRGSQPHNNCYVWLDSFKPDLVVISQGNHREGVTWKRQCLKRGIPFVAIVHLVSDLQWPDDRLADQLCDVYGKAVVNYFVSQKNVDSLEKLIGAKLDNAKFVRNPFKVPYDNNLPYPSTEPFFNLAVVGSLHPIHKGQDMLFEVLRQDKWKERPLKVSLYGQGPNERLLKRLKELWQLDRVEFKGFQKDVIQIWKENHGLLMGSRMEGLPLAVVEAMLCQRIVIVPDIAGNGEIVRDNKNSFLAKAPTSFFLDEALERAWELREDWEAMGKVASRDIQQIIPPDPPRIFADELVSLL
jgi:glycosyltransferase involved in cell wall biosynthesis